MKIMESKKKKREREKKKVKMMLSVEREKQRINHLLELLNSAIIVTVVLNILLDRR